MLTITQMHWIAAALPCHCHAFVEKWLPLSLVHRSSRVSTVASVSGAVDSESAGIRNLADVELACPICCQPFSSTGFTSQSPTLTASPPLHCNSCRKDYRSKNGIFDLTISTTDPNNTLQLGVSLFQIPLLAFVYGRGYRDQFWILNFPGADEEFEMAQEIMLCARGQVVMDLSCGSGMFMKRFLASEEYKLVIGVDYSEAMLEECLGLLQNETREKLMNAVLIRADAGRLPFATSSVAAIHAAAAIHCWPQPLTAVAEVARVLKPGGVFVASTFILHALPFPLKSFHNLAGCCTVGSPVPVVV